MNLNFFSLFLAVSSVVQISTLKKKMKLVTIDWCNLQDSDGEKLRKESNISITIIMSIMIIIAVFVLCLFYVSGPFFCCEYPTCCFRKSLIVPADDERTVSDV